MTGRRIPWDIPVEDFLFGFSMVTLTIAAVAAPGPTRRRPRRRTVRPPPQSERGPHDHRHRPQRPRDLRRGGPDVRPDGGAQPRLPRPAAPVGRRCWSQRCRGPPTGRCASSTSAAARGPPRSALEAALQAAGLAHEIVGVDGSAGMLSRPAQDVAGAGALRAGRRRAARPGDVRTAHLAARARRRRVRGVPRAQRDRPRRAARPASYGCCVPGGAARGARVQRRREPRGRRGVGRRLAGASWCRSALLTAPRSPIYRYLWRSVVDFDSAHLLRGRMVAAGLDEVRSRSFGGWQRGVLHTFVAPRPA